MAFGTILKSFAAPGNAGSTHSLAWDGVRLWVGNDKGNTIIGVDPVTGQTVQTVDFTVNGDTLLCWMGTGWLAGTVAAAIVRYYANGYRTREQIVSAFSSNIVPTHAVCIGHAIAWRGTGGESSDGRVYRYEPGHGAWAFASVSAVASYAGKGLAYDGVHFYTGTNTSPRYINKRDAVTLSVVASAAAPVDDIIEGMVWGGDKLWVACNGATDRIYAVSPY